MPLFGWEEGMYTAKSALETLVQVGVVGGIGLLCGLYYYRFMIPKNQQQRQKLYQDMEKILPEQRPAVMQLLQDLREGTPRSSSAPGYHIDHLLGRYSPK